MTALFEVKKETCPVCKGMKHITNVHYTERCEKMEYTESCWDCHGRGFLQTVVKQPFEEGWEEEEEG